MMKMALAFPLLCLAACGGAPKADYKPIAVNVFATAIDPAAPRGEVEKAFRDQCGSRQWCKVIGFGDSGAVAKAMPLTEREQAAVKVIYTLNRGSGVDEFVWS